MADDWTLDDPTTGAPQAKNPLQATMPAATTNAAQTSYESAWSAAAPATAPTAAASTPASAPANSQLAPAVEKQNYVLNDLGVSPSAGAWDTTQPSTGAAQPDYSAHVAAVQTAANPQDYLAKQDQLARRVASDLQAAGHDVKWQGNQLIVDGRPYEVGGQSWSGSSGANGGPADWHAAAQQLMATLPSTPASIDQIIAAIPGAKRATHANGTLPSDDKIVLPNGQIVDLLVNSGLGGWQWDDGSGGGGAAAASGGTPLGPSMAAPPPNYDALWSPSAGDPYTAGHIGNEDLPDFTYESLLRDATSGNPVEAGTDAAVNELLAHPESLDARTVAMMEAKDAEEQQQAALQSDNALKRFGFQSGLADSNWLASERASTARAADANIISNRRNIETEAAKTNTADRRAAAGIGVTYQGQRASQKQAAVNAAVSGAMQKAAETRNRFQLNEDLKVEAAKLKLSKEELVQQYAVAKINDLSKRYGIDLGYDIDTKKLAQQGDQFQADLLFRLQSLEQQDQQFGANLGLNYDQLNEKAANDYWNGTTGG